MMLVDHERVGVPDGSMGMGMTVGRRALPALMVMIMVRVVMRMQMLMIERRMFV